MARTRVEAKKTRNNQGVNYTDQGIIESVSVQGTQIFAVIRLVGSSLPDMMGSTIRCAQHLVGLPRYAPEHTANMAELLIPITATYATQIVDPKFLIGSRAQVFFRSTGFPEGAVVLGNPNSREISREEMFKLRSENKDGIIDQFTKKKLQLTDKDTLSKVEKVSEEIYDQTFHKGAVGVYGNEQNMFVATDSQRADYVDFSTKTNSTETVILDAQKETRTKDCYRPATIFTGRT